MSASGKPLSVDSIACLRISTPRAVASAEATPGDVPSIQRLIDDLRLHQVELEQQNEALREAQGALEHARREERRIAERYRELYHSAPVGYLSLDARGVVCEANPMAGELLAAAAPDQLLGRSLAEFVQPESQDVWYRQRRGLVEQRSPATFTLSIGRPPAARRFVEVWARAGSAASDPSIRVALIDVTERERAWRARDAAEARAVLAEQRERRRVAEELHDDVGQTLSLLAMRLSACASGADPEAPNLAKLLDHARRRISSLSAQLSPNILYDLGLVAAARWLCDEMARTYGLRVELTSNVNEVEEMGEVSRTVLFRALRECLVNVARHARTPHAVASLRLEGDRVVLDLHDTGRGFDIERTPAGFGLESIRRGLEQIGGTFCVESRIGAGTRIYVTAPVDRATECECGVAYE